MQVDLVLLSLGGVQRFIGESRSTADVAGASEVIQRLAGLAARTAHHRLDGSPAPCGLIFPAAPDAPSITNKIAFLARPGTGPEIARAAAVEVGRDWRARLEQTFDTKDPPDTPGMPDLAWVSVTGPVVDGDYGALWEAAQREMVGRRRARVFEPVEIPRQKLCAQSPGLPAVPAPPGSLPHERDEALSAAGWAKRRAGSQRFPSTVSIASSVFRSRLLERADDDPEVVAELLAPVRALTTALDRLPVHPDRSKLRWCLPPPVWSLSPGASGLGRLPGGGTSRGLPGSTASRRCVQYTETALQIGDGGRRSSDEVTARMPRRRLSRYRTRRVSRVRQDGYRAAPRGQGR